MMDPPRLSDDDTLGALLLRAGRSEVPSRPDLHRTLAAVGATGAVLGASHAAAAAASVGKVGAWTLAKWAGAGIVSGVLTVGGAELVRDKFASGPSTPAATPEKHESARSDAVREGPAERLLETLASADPSFAAPPSTVAPPEQSLDSPARDPGSAAPTVQIPRSAPLAAADDSAVVVEVRLLDEARRALAEKRGPDALRALARYRAEAPSQRLAPEASYLEMETHLLVGDEGSARRAASALIDRYPDGPHAARARQVQGDQSGASRR